MSGIGPSSRPSIHVFFSELMRRYTLSIIVTLCRHSWSAMLLLCTTLALLEPQFFRSLRVWRHILEILFLWYSTVYFRYVVTTAKHSFVWRFASIHKRDKWLEFFSRLSDKFFYWGLGEVDWWPIVSKEEIASLIPKWRNNGENVHRWACLIHICSKDEWAEEDIVISSSCGRVDWDTSPCVRFIYTLAGANKMLQYAELEDMATLIVPRGHSFFLANVTDLCFFVSPYDHLTDGLLRQVANIGEFVIFQKGLSQRMGSEADKIDGIVVVAKRVLNWRDVLRKIFDDEINFVSKWEIPVTAKISCNPPYDLSTSPFLFE